MNDISLKVKDIQLHKSVPYALLERPLRVVSGIFTGRNEVVAKVMFSQVCVCPQGGRVSASVHAGMPYPPRPGRHPPDQGDPPGPGRHPPGPGRPPQTRQTPRDQADTPPPPRPGRPPPPDQPDPPGTRQTPPLDQADTPPGSRLQHMVYERPVRILLECILVVSSDCHWRCQSCSFMCKDKKFTCSAHLSLNVHRLFLIV